MATHGGSSSSNAAAKEKESGSSSNRTMWQLERESELRLEIANDATLTLVLRQDQAEVFGMELAANHEYTFSGVNIAVYTWYGCILETTGKAKVAYQSAETPMIQFVNTHAQLEAKRTAAMQGLMAGQSGPNGPRVMIVGPPDSGKSTLASILTAYAVRLNRTPTYVDLDVGGGQVTVPGVLAAAALDSNTMSVEEGFSLAAPLVYHYGYLSPRENPELYKLLVEELASAVEQRLRNDREAAAAGLIINTSSWVEGVGYQLLLHAIGALNVDVVLVMGQDRLYSDLLNSLPAAVTVVKLPRSGGVVHRDDDQRRRDRSARIREYFYGKTAIGAGSGGGLAGKGAPPAAAAPPPLSPSVAELSFESIRICSVGAASVSSDMLPLGQASLLGPTKVTRVRPTTELTHSLLAVCHPMVAADGTVLGQDSGKGDDAERVGQELLRSNAAGFLYVTSVDLDRGKMTVLAPCPGALPSSHLFVGKIRWLG